MDFGIAIDIADLIGDRTPLTGNVFSELAHAVAAITEMAHLQWVAYATGNEALPNGQVIRSRTGEYGRSIQVRHLGDFATEVYSELAYAAAIENGSPAYDMKRMLDTSLKVRLTAKGKRYLIIPFRWGTPGTVGFGQAMPDEVHRWWREQQRSAITGIYRRLSGTGAYDLKTRQKITVNARRYEWGARLGAGDLAAMGVSGKVAQHMAGMVNFRKPNARGGAAHSKFLTFRTMVEGSKGWMVPAQVGKFPARTTSEIIAPVAEEAFRKAVQADIAKKLGGEII